MDPVVFTQNYEGRAALTYILPLFSYLAAFNRDLLAIRGTLTRKKMNRTAKGRSLRVAFFKRMENECPRFRISILLRKSDGSHDSLSKGKKMFADAKPFRGVFSQMGSKIVQLSKHQLFHAYRQETNLSWMCLSRGGELLQLSWAKKDTKTQSF